MNKPGLLLLADFILEVHTLANESNEAEDRQIYEMFLSRASIITAKLIKECPINDDVSSMERPFGKTWLKDRASYSRAYAAWAGFQKSLE